MRLSDRARGVQVLLLGWEFFVRSARRLERGRKSSTVFFLMGVAPCPSSFLHRSNRDQGTTHRNNILQQLRPKIDAAVRHLVGSGPLDVPEAKEFGAIDFEFRDVGQQLVNEVRQASVASRKKRGTTGASVTCFATCDYAAKFHSYQLKRRVLTVHGEVQVRRAVLHYSSRCHHSYLPYDDVLGLVDEISPGLMPLVTLAGTLVPFADAAEDVLKRFAGVRLSPSTVLRCTDRASERAGAAEAGTAWSSRTPSGAEVDGTASRRPAGGVRGARCVQRADARGRGEQGGASHDVRGAAVHAGQGTYALPGRF